jgi:Phosphoribosylamine-glycine ligase
MKAFIQRCNIPTPHGESFTNYETACAYIQKQKLPLTIKTDGINQTGVIINDTHDSALVAAKDMLINLNYGNAGKKIMVENYISDQEISFIVITDGFNIIPLTTTHNHPKRDSGDKGPHTMGMGSCCPSPIVNEAMNQRIIKEIIEPLIKGLNKENKSFTGFLTTKIVVDRKNNPHLIEFICNSGDPETPTMLMRMQSDLYALCNAALEKKLDQFSVTWDERFATSVVLINQNYPFNTNKGSIITGIPTDLEKYNGYLFHGNTRLEQDKLTTDGCHVMCAVSLGKTLEMSRYNTYALIKDINWPEMHYRRDIGYKAIAKSRV